MKLIIGYAGDVTAEWASDHGAHTRNVTDDMPAALLAQVVAWADGREAELRAEFENYRTHKDIDFAIAQLQEKKRKLG